MNKTKFKKYLKKIKSFEDWIDTDEQLSAIENDLLLDYVKKLYEAILEKEDEHKAHKTKKKKKEEEIVHKQIIKEEKEDLQEEQVISEKKEIIEEDIPEAEEVAEEEKEPEIEYTDEFLSIFNDSHSNELSEKLSKRPIKDLKKAFGINEKIFTVKEIFKGDKNAFEEAIERFNNFNDFEEAKKYVLNELAPVYDWDKPGNIKKIGQFIKIIQRRYIK